MNIQNLSPVAHTDQTATPTSSDADLKLRPRWRVPGNIELLVALLLVVLVNIPILSRNFVLSGDTLSQFENFFLQYNELLFHSSLAHWYPNVLYGQPTGLNVGTSPVGYMFYVLGWLLRMTDVAELYKVVVIGNECVFVAGVFCCAGLIFRHRISTLLVCSTAALFTVWHNQIWCNLIIYYLFPWVAYFLLRFSKAGHFQDLWLAGLTVILWELSSPPYYIGVYLFVCIVFLAALLLSRLGANWHPRFSDPGSIFSATIMVLTAGLVGLYLLHVRDNYLLAAPGRSSSGAVSIQTFLTWDIRMTSRMLVDSLVAGDGTHDIQYGGYINCAVYFGMLPLMLAIVSPIWLRRPAHFAFLAVTLCMLELSAAGVAARFFYYFPLMCYVRYIQNFYCLAKVAALFCAGFTIDELLSSQRRLWRTMLSFLLLAFIIWHYRLYILLCAADSYFVGQQRVQLYVVSVFVGILGLLYLAKSCSATTGAASRNLRNFGGLLLLISVLLDLGTYRAVIYRSYPTMPARYASALKCMQVRPIAYVPMRTSGPNTLEQARAYFVVNGPYYVYDYPVTAAFCNADFRYCTNRIDCMTEPVSQLLQVLDPQYPIIRWNNYYWANRMNIESLLDHLYPRYAEIVGGAEPKMRLLSDVENAANDALAQSDISDLKDPVHEGIIEGQLAPGAEQQNPASNTVDFPGSASVVSFSSDRLTADVDVKARPGAYLIYDDSYCTGWHASDNGKETKISKADVAFKAIWLATGTHVVTFWFDAGLQGHMEDIMFVFGALCGLGFTSGLVVLCVKPQTIAYMPLDFEWPIFFKRTNQPQ